MKKNYFLLIIVLLVLISCQKINSKYDIKTVDSLTNVSQENDIKNDTNKIPKNVFIIEVENNKFEVYFNKKLIAENNLVELDSYLKKNQKEILNSKFYIVGDRNVEYSNMKEIFELLKKYDIMNFELVSK